MKEEGKGWMAKVEENEERREEGEEKEWRESKLVGRQWRK